MSFEEIRQKKISLQEAFLKFGNDKIEKIIKANWDSYKKHDEDLAAVASRIRAELDTWIGEENERKEFVIHQLLTLVNSESNSPTKIEARELLENQISSISKVDNDKGILEVKFDSSEEIAAKYIADYFNKPHNKSRSKVLVNPRMLAKRINTEPRVVANTINKLGKAGVIKSKRNSPKKVEIELVNKDSLNNVIGRNNKVF